MKDKKETTHTAGPWHVETWTYPEPRGKVLVIVGGTPDAVAAITPLWRPDETLEEHHANAEGKANAALIAGAPDTLIAARLALAMLKNLPDLLGGIDAKFVRERLEEAITKSLTYTDATPAPPSLANPPT